MKAKEIGKIAVRSKEGTKLAVELLELAKEREGEELAETYDMIINAMKNMATIGRWVNELQKYPAMEDKKPTQKGAAAIRDMGKLMDMIEAELEQIRERHPWLEEEDSLSKLVSKMLFGTSDRQPAGIAAQLADEEREKIGPEALQRMADVFNGPEAER